MDKLPKKLEKDGNNWKKIQKKMEKDGEAWGAKT